MLAEHLRCDLAQALEEQAGAIDICSSDATQLEAFSGDALLEEG